MTDLDLGGDWKRSVDGRPVDFVRVPGAYKPLGVCELERGFHCPDASQGRWFLVTEGVLTEALFTLNGQELGTAGPWNTYRFEIPAGLLRAHNVLVAKVTDITLKFGPAPGRSFEAGLFRKIFLERRPAVFIESVAFEQKLNDGMDGAECRVKAVLHGGQAPLKAVLREKRGGRVVVEAAARAGADLEFTVRSPALWSPESPSLYTLSVSLAAGEADSLEETVGFRRLEVKGPDFWLNGERLLLKGVCRHEFMSGFGYSVPDGEVHREMADIKRNGFNYVRLVHSPQAPAAARAAAELGLLVSEEPGTCFHDLGDPALTGPALESLRRLVLRDRNLPSVFAWLIYNECNPHTGYAVQAAALCRELDPGRLLSFADCSGRNDDIKAMVQAAGLSFYGINVYSFEPRHYVEKMEVFGDKPLVFTEWGGWICQGNPRVLGQHCGTFIKHSRTGEALRMAGCSFWVWADYEEYTRGGPASVDGWTVEGLMDRDRRPKADLQALSDMFFAMDRPESFRAPAVELLAVGKELSPDWQCVSLESVEGGQSSLEEEIESWRASQGGKAPVFGRWVVEGIPFVCRDAKLGQPLLIGKGRESCVIPVGMPVRSLAVLGQVAFKGGYPSSGIWTVHHGKGQECRVLGSPAAEYAFIFAEGVETQPLLHGVHVLRSNDICRWWKVEPRSAELKPALRTVVNANFEILRLDLWEKSWPAPRFLKEIRWTLKDPDCVLGVFALSVKS